MSPSAKSANPPPRASLYPSPSSSFTPPPAVFDSDHQTALSVLSNAKLAGPSQSIVSACPVSEICDDKENLHRPRSNSTNSIAKRASFTSSNDGQQPGKSSAHSSRRSSVTYPSSPTTLRASKHRKSRPISLASAASAEHRMHETKEPTSPKRPVSELSSVYGSSVDSHTIPESAQRRVPLADARSNSGYSVSSSAGESPLSINTDLPPQLYHRPVSTAGSATTPRRRSLRESKGSNLDSDAAYLDLPTVAPELVSASSDSTLTATLLASLPVVKIRDFAFPNADPRHVGEPAEIQPIEIPPSSSGHESPWRSGYLSAEGIRGDPSAAILSSSSSSSLSSSFTPPPFGSFGFGNPYHYSHKPGGVASSKDSPRPGEPGWSPQCQHSNESSGPSKSKYSWGFVTDNSSDSTPYGQENNESAFSNTTQRDFRGDQGIPSILMGSGLSTSEFHEFDDGNEDEEGADGSDFDASNQQGVQIPTGGLLYRAAYPFTAEAPQEMNLREGGESGFCFGDQVDEIITNAPAPSVYLQTLYECTSSCAMAGSSRAKCNSTRTTQRKRWKQVSYHRTTSPFSNKR